MIVGIPTWMGRVSPVLDVAVRFWLVHLENGTPSQQQELLIEPSAGSSLVVELQQAGVNVLICGAVSHPLLQELLRANIEVLAHVCGECQEVLSAFLADSLDELRFKMPGCRRDHCSFQHGYRRRRRRGHQNRPFRNR